MFSRPRKHAPFTNSTLHAFQRKPNKRHDVFNAPYLGNPKKKRPTSGPERHALQPERATLPNKSTRDMRKVEKLVGQHIASRA